MLPRSWSHTAIRSLSSPSHNSSIYVSTSTSPYFNLSMEDWLFRETPPEQPLLFLYRNDACVVIGRNQNPWTELNFPALRALGVPFIRRRSGGGTVYHDLGNTNFSIHLPRTSFNRRHTTKLVQHALVSLGVDAIVNERNDICVGGFKMSSVNTDASSILFLYFDRAYVSGSAYKIVHKRAYHHGTMLISTELGRLRDVLRNTKDGMVTKGVASVRSPVHNLCQFKPDMNHSVFVDAVIGEFTREYQVNPHVTMIHDDVKTREIEHLRHGIAELQQWEWQYGQTPEFTHHLTGVFKWGEIMADIRSKGGIILSCHLSASNTVDQGWCRRLGQSIIGSKYASLKESDEGVEDVISAQRRQDTRQWLMEEM